ncbi:MAG: glycosyltransferase family 39 protein [Bacteroidales bacterium]|nr:glycosyltransferase family 39 protein [Bacteroidales bacterium]
MQKLIIWHKIEQRKYLLLAIAVAVGFFIAKLPYLHLPFFWDEAWVYGPAVRLMANTNLSLMPDALPVGLSRGHPLLFHFLNAAWIRIFGDSLEIIHLFNLLIACILAFAIYLFGKNFFSEKIGFASAFIFCLQPVFLAQSTLVLPETMLALFSLVALYGYLRNNYITYFIFASAAVLTKETGIAVILACEILTLINEFKDAKASFRRFILKIIKMALPVIPLMVFLIIQYFTHGWFLFSEHVDFVSFDISTIYKKLIKGYLTFGFIVQGRNLLFYFALMAVAWMIYQKKELENKHAIIALVVFIMVYSFIGAVNFLTKRYMLSIIPPIILLSSGIIFQVFKNRYVLPVMLVIYSVTQAKYINQKTNCDHNLGFVNILIADQCMINYCLENNLKDEKFAVYFIGNVIMTTPYSGFVEGDEVFNNICANPEEAEYYIITNYDTNEQYTAYRNDERLVLLKQFQYGDARTELYKKKPNYLDN